MSWLSIWPRFCPWLDGANDFYNLNLLLYDQFCHASSSVPACIPARVHLLASKVNILAGYSHLVVQTDVSHQDAAGPWAGRKLVEIKCDDTKSDLGFSVTSNWH